MRKIVIVIILLFTVAVSAESISVSLKPAKGLSGTTSLTIHDDGSVTVLTYESSTKIEEHTIKTTEEQKDKIRSVVLTALNSYLLDESVEDLELSDFSISFLHTKQDVSKSITSRRLNEAAKQALKQVFLLVPNMKMDYVDEKI